MIPVEQKQFFDEDAGTRGDCLKCCLASILELDYDSVPHFAVLEDGCWPAMTDWLAGRGWILGNAYWQVAHDSKTSLIGWTDGYWLAVVKSRRTRRDGTHLSHMVVMGGREIAWDPHPDRDEGHLGFSQGYRMLPVDPARFVLK